MTVLLIDNYDSFTFNLYQLLQPLVSAPIEVFRNDAIDLPTVLAKRPTHVILSPGPGHPGNPRDFGICRDILHQQAALNCPILGVCLGHQGIVHHKGGHVTPAPEIVHGKTSLIHITQPSPLLEGLPNPFRAMRYHSLVASNEALPEDLVVTAREEAHGLIMALEHTHQPVYGIQFHPESIGTPEGARLLRNFIENCRSAKVAPPPQPTRAL